MAIVKPPITLLKNFGIGLIHLTAAGVAAHLLCIYQEAKADKVWTQSAVDGGIQVLSEMPEQSKIAQIFDTHVSNEKRIKRLKLRKQELQKKRNVL